MNKHTSDASLGTLAKSVGADCPTPTATAFGHHDDDPDLINVQVQGMQG